MDLPFELKTLDQQVAEARRQGYDVSEVCAATGETPQTFVVDLALTNTSRRRLRYAYCATEAHLAVLLQWLDGQKTVAFDIETNGLDPVRDGIATFQFGALGHASGIDAWVLDIRAVTRAALEPVLAFLAGRETIKLGQNIRFEYRFIREQLGTSLRALADTQVAEMVIRAGLLSPKGQARGKGEERAAYRATSMNALMKRYAQIEIDKDPDVRTSFYATPSGCHSIRQIIYAASDVVYPFVIAQAQRQLIDDRGLRGIIKVEMELIPVLGEMEYRGMKVDKGKWRALWQEALTKRAEAERQLDDIFRPCTLQGDLFDTVEVKARPVYPKLGRPLNYSSAEQVRWALKAYCELIKWPVRVVIDKKELQKLKQEHGAAWIKRQEEQGKPVDINDLPDWLLPEDQFCILTEADKKTLILRKCRKQLPANVVDLLIEFSKYDIRCDTFGNEWLLKNVSDRTGRLHTEVHQAVTNTGRLSTTPNCYDDQTEVLTDRGWVRFADLTSTDTVAQVDPGSKEVTFVVPSERYAAPYTGEMRHWKAQYVNLLVTPHHRMLVERRSGHVEVIRADGLVPNRKHFVAGRLGLGNGPLNPDEVRWLAAVAARGTLTPKYLELDPMPRAQMALLVDIAERLGYPDLHVLLLESGEWRGWVAADHPLAQLAEAYLGAEGTFGAWVLQLKPVSRQAFITAVRQWFRRGPRLQTLVMASENAHWVQALCSVTGLRAVVHDDGEVAELLIAPRDHVWTTTVASDVVEYTGMVYCVTVPKGMVLVRRADAAGTYVTAVSGNTQNIPSDPRYRQCFVPAQDYKFVIADYSQQEPRLLAQLSRDPVYLSTYERNDDLYLAVAEAMLGHRPDKHTPEGALERKIFKIIVLAMAYRAGARKLRDQLTLGLEKPIMAGEVEPPSLEYARDLHKRFFDVHEKVLEFQDQCSSTADPKSKGSPKIWDDFVGDVVTYVRAPCGRLRLFPPSAENTFTEGANSPIQGGSATMTKAAACLIQRMIDAEGWQDKAFVVNLVHDEIVCEVHETIAEAFAPKMQALMVEAGRFYCPDVAIAAEFPEGSQGVVDYWCKEVLE